MEVLERGERELVGASGRDPRQAAALLATTGAAALLMTSAYPELAELSRRLRQEAGSGDSGTMTAGMYYGSGSPDEAPSGPDPTFPDPTFPDPSPTPTPTLEPSLDPGAFDFGTTATFADLDLSAFDGVDSAFDAVDSGVDAGGGDGGGDGGDGGGGD